MVKVKFFGGKLNFYQKPKFFVKKFCGLKNY